MQLAQFSGLLQRGLVAVDPQRWETALAIAPLRVRLLSQSLRAMRFTLSAKTRLSLACSACACLGLVGGSASCGSYCLLKLSCLLLLFYCFLNQAMEVILQEFDELVGKLSRLAVVAKFFIASRFCSNRNLNASWAGQGRRVYSTLPKPCARALPRSGLLQQLPA